MVAESPDLGKPGERALSNPFPFRHNSVTEAQCVSATATTFSTRPWRKFVANLRRFFLFLALFAGVEFIPTSLAAQGLEISSRASKMRIGGRIHSQLAHSTAEDGKSADFFIRRARLVFDVEISDLVSGRLEHDFAIGLQDAFFKFNFDPAFMLSVGQFKRAFDLFELDSTTQISVVERTGRIPGLSTCSGPGGICSLSQFTEMLHYSGRDTGVRVEGELGRVSYLASLTNGTKAGEADENSGKSFAGRVVVPIGEELRLGGNLSVHDYELDEDTSYGSAFGADLELGRYLHPGPHLQLGVVAGDNWAAGEDASFLTGQAVYMHYIPLDRRDGNIVGIEPVARISWGDPHRDLDDDAGTLLTPGLMLYFKQRTRIGAALDIWEPQSGGTEFSFKVQTYLCF
jgi:hypothetical protein